MTRQCIQCQHTFTHQELDNLKGRWPQYPQRFLDLARKYDISVPGVMLPGSPHQWAKLYPGRRK